MNLRRSVGRLVNYLYATLQRKSQNGAETAVTIEGGGTRRNAIHARARYIRLRVIYQGKRPCCCALPPPLPCRNQTNSFTQSIKAKLGTYLYKELFLLI